VTTSTLFGQLVAASTFFAGSQRFLDWMIAGSVLLVVFLITLYRAIARGFDLGPRDT